MGFLEELKQEAEAARTEKPGAADEATERIFQRMLRPRMKALYAYLQQVVQHLNRVELDAKVSYAVEGCGTLSDLRPGNFKLVAEDRRDLRRFTLRYTCSRGGNIQFSKATREASERQREYLWTHGLRFTSKVAADGKGVFVLQPCVPIAFEFEADVERVAIRLRHRNLRTLGSSIHYYSPESINEEFMDELARCIAQRPNRFDELSGNTVSSETRMRLRQQLEEQRRRHEAELDATSRAPAERKGLLQRSFRRALFGNR